MSDNLLSAPELEQIANRALRFQRYIFRRAWGVYYAMWAAAIVTFSFGYQLLNLISPTLPWVVYAVFYGGIGFGAGFASYWIFRNAAKTAKLRRALEPDPKSRLRYRLMGIWWIAFYIIIALSFSIYSSYALTILYGMLFAVVAFVYYMLGFSFPGAIPGEGKLAVLSYALSCAVSLVASVVTSSYIPETVAWAATVGIWLFCALYSLKRAPEELVERAF